MTEIIKYTPILTFPSSRNKFGTGKGEGIKGKPKH
jgi:hypothetical protein